MLSLHCQKLCCYSEPLKKSRPVGGDVVKPVDRESKMLSLFSRDALKEEYSSPPSLQQSLV